MIASAILDYYGDGNEEQRLARSLGRLERIRTREIIGRYMPPPPCRVLDIGGGTGVYALPLSHQGYEVRLIDAVPLKSSLPQVKTLNRLNDFSWHLCRTCHCAATRRNPDATSFTPSWSAS